VRLSPGEPDYRVGAASYAIRPVPGGKPNGVGIRPHRVARLPIGTKAQVSPSGCRER
jgi:hypothetical protein